jgi:hypothetical protein
MPEPTAWETIKVQGGQVVEELKKLLHEGNVRRVIVKQKGRSVAEFPVTVGVVGALLAPVLAAIGALVAVLADCSIEVERAAEPGPTKAASARPTARARRQRS